jgi:hypothetical protein
MYLIDHIHFILAGLGYKTHLVHQVPDIVHRVVGRGIQLKIHRSAIVKRSTTLAFIAGFPIFGRMFAIDRLGQDTGTGSLAHSAGSAE